MPGGAGGGGDSDHPTITDKEEFEAFRKKMAVRDIWVGISIFVLGFILVALLDNIMEILTDLYIGLPH